MSTKYEVTRPENWQFALGALGLITWISLMCNLKAIQDWHSLNLRTFTTGYVFGFVVAYGGNMLLSLLTQRGRERLKPTNPEEWFLTILIGAVFGGVCLLAFWMQLYIPEPVPFVLGMTLGTFIVNQGVTKFLLELDRWRERPHMG